MPSNRQRTVCSSRCVTRNIIAHHEARVCREVRRLRESVAVGFPRSERSRRPGPDIRRSVFHFLEIETPLVCVWGRVFPQLRRSQKYVSKLSSRR